MASRLARGSAPRTKADIDSEQAQAAFDQGERLLSAGEARQALSWLERARRIAPDQVVVTDALARALFAVEDFARAEPLLEQLAAQDVRDVLISLAVARLRLGRAEAAAEALAAALARHRLDRPDDIGPIAQTIARLANAPGWCGLGEADRLLAHPADPRRQRDLVVLADGVALPRGRVPAAARQLSVTLGGRHLLGSPIQLEALRRVEGFVAARDGGLEGWAWLPGDAGRDPVLSVEAADGRVLRLTASTQHGLADRPLARPRRFVVPAADLAALAGPLRVCGADGRDLSGSPLDPGRDVRAATEAALAVARALPADRPRRRGPPPWLPMPASLTPQPARAPGRPRRRVAVVVPVYRDVATTLACLRAVLATVPGGTEVIVVDDASPEPGMRPALARLASAHRLRVIRHARNAGFPGAANTGLRAAAALRPTVDAVLLNSDTVPAGDWLARLRAAVQSAPDIGTAGPFSNDATILTYPDPARPGPPPEGAALAELAASAASALDGVTVDVPTGVGFCLYIRHECLRDTGLLREDAFGQGYGEENDFCLRARHLGWRHVAVPGAFVAHAGGVSFGAARSALLARNLEVLERLHPGYRALIETWQASDPLAPARRTLDAARWAARPQRGGSVVLVTHDSGGGVERAVRARCAELAAQGLDAVVLRPVVDYAGADPDRRYVPGLCAVGEAPNDDDGGNRFPNLRYRVPEELPALVALLAQARPRWVELHHLLGHHECMTDLAQTLGIPYEIRVHDYSLICARINLIGPERRYCGEPDVAACDACVADAGGGLEEDIAPADLRRRSAAALAGARAVVVPSVDTQARLRRYFPRAQMEIVPHEDDTALPPLKPPGPAPRRVGVIGAIGIAKGYETLLACARDAARRNLPLSFTVIGHTEDDARLLDSGRVFVTGPYAERDAVALIREHRLDLAWLPSLWPETWCYALGEALRAGLAAVVFDIGAPAERVRRTGRGSCLPLGLPAAAINNALLALQTVAGHEVARSVAARAASALTPSPPRSLTAST